jgi:peptidylprolyl isomerase
VLPFLFILKICDMSIIVKEGDLIAVHYEGSLEDGTIFDSSIPRKQPLEFTAGAGQMIPGFDQAVLGMRLGEKKTVILPPALAYGDVDPRRFIEVPRRDLPPDLHPEVGDQLALNTSDGRQFPVRVVEVSATSILLDANHDLAGKTLVFKIALVSINRSNAADLLPDW